MVATRKLSTKELKKRIRTLRNWKVKAAQDSIKEYREEIKRRR